MGLVILAQHDAVAGTPEFESRQIIPVLDDLPLPVLYSGRPAWRALPVDSSVEGRDDLHGGVNFRSLDVANSLTRSMLDESGRDTRPRYRGITLLVVPTFAIHLR
jgi:hypothetical protein